jgi:hypothetical protein
MLEVRVTLIALAREILISGFEEVKKQAIPHSPRAELTDVGGENVWHQGERIE